MTIVAAVDRTEDAAKVVEEADRLAVAFDEDLHIIHVLSRSEFVSIERDSTEQSGTSIPLDEIRAAAASIAQDAAEDTTIPTETHGFIGDAADEILNHAANVDASYIVLGGRKRSPVGKAVFGSVTQSVLLSTDRPVISVRI